MTDPLFTPTPPTAPGLYYWRADETSAVEVVFVRTAGKWMAIFRWGYVSGIGHIGGEWGPQIPPPEECAAYWRTKR